MKDERGQKPSAVLFPSAFLIHPSSFLLHPSEVGSPDREILFELDVETLRDAGPDQVDEAEHVAAGGVGVDDDVVGAAVVHLGAADAGAGQAGVGDEGGGVEAA